VGQKYAAAVLTLSAFLPPAGALCNHGQFCATLEVKSTTRGSVGLQGYLRPEAGTLPSTADCRLCFEHLAPVPHSGSKHLKGSRT
jgi:hypothetical protein